MIIWMTAFLVLTILNLSFAIKNLAFPKGSESFGLISRGNCWGVSELMMSLLCWGAALYCFGALQGILQFGFQ